MVPDQHKVCESYAQEFFQEKGSDPPQETWRYLESYSQYTFYSAHSEMVVEEKFELHSYNIVV